MISKDQLKPGVIVRFEDGSEWDVLSIKDGEVSLNGPRPCRGISACSLDELLACGEFVGQVERRRTKKTTDHTTVRYLAVLGKKDGVRVKRLEGVLIPHAVHLDEMVLYTDDGESYPEAKLHKTDREAWLHVAALAVRNARVKSAKARHASEVAEEALNRLQKALEMLKMLKDPE